MEGRGERRLELGVRGKVGVHWEERAVKSQEREGEGGELKSRNERGERRSEERDCKEQEKGGGGGESAG